MSFLEDLVGGIAKAGADVTGDITKQNARDRELQLQNDLAIERQRTAEKLRIQLEDERAAARQKRISDQQAEIEAAAPAVTAARQLGEAQSRAPSVDGNVLDIIKSKLTPEQLKKFYGVDTGAVAGINDRLGIARQKGYYDAEAELKASRTETVAELKAEYDRQFQERRIANQEDNLARQYARDEQRHGETMAAITQRQSAAELRAGKSTNGEKMDKLTTQASVIQRDIDKILEAKGAPNAAKDPRYVQLVQDLDEIYGELRARRKKNHDATDDEPAKPAAPAAKTAAKTAAPAPAARPPLASFKK